MRTTSTEHTLRTLVADIRSDVGVMVSDQIALAKSEITASTKSAATSAILFVAAVGAVLAALILLLFAAAYGLVAAGMATWAAFLVVAGVLLLMAAVLVAVGVRMTKQVRGPERTMRTLSGTRAALDATPRVDS